MVHQKQRTNKRASRGNYRRARGEWFKLATRRGLRVEKLFIRNAVVIRTWPNKHKNSKG